MLKEILSISGKPGLFKLINNTANALIVESLLDGKRFPAYSNAKIIALEDISIYTEDEDMPLKTVFKRMYEKEEGKPAINHKESSAAITNYIESVIPEYDADRVYVSDMRKMIQWYNLLLDKNLLNFDEPEEEKKEPTGVYLKRKEEPSENMDQVAKVPRIYDDIDDDFDDFDYDFFDEDDEVEETAEEEAAKTEEEKKSEEATEEK